MYIHKPHLHMYMPLHSYIIYEMAFGKGRGGGGRIMENIELDQSRVSQGKKTQKLGRDLVYVVDIDAYD